jgi:hypothetical protein
MNSRRIDRLEKQIRQKTGAMGCPAPGFFNEGDPAIETYRENLLKQGYPLERVMATPVFIEPIDWREFH